MSITSSGSTLSFVRPTVPIGALSRFRATAGSSTRDKNIAFVANSGTPKIGPYPGRRTIRYTDDSEILAMSDKEYIEAINALGGLWADREDIPDNWLDEIRGEWDKRLVNLYGSSSDTPNSSF